MKKFNTKKEISKIIAILFLTLSLMAGVANAQTGRGDAGENNGSDMVIVNPDKGQNNEEPLILPGPDDIIPPNPYSAENYVKISGVVKADDGHPIGKVWINARYEILMADGVYPEKPQVFGGAETNDNGEFSILVPQGYQYDLFVETYAVADLGVMGGFFQDTDGGNASDPGADKVWSGTTTNNWSKRTLIDVGSEGISGIAVTLNPGTKIYGKAVDSKGTPVKEIWIDAQADFTGEDKENIFWGGWAGSSTDENGNFSIVVFPDAKYRISSFPWKNGFTGGYWKETADNQITASGKDGILALKWEDATLLNVSSDIEINIILDKGNTISGRVTDEAGEPVANVWVETYSEGASGCVQTPGADGSIEYEKCVPVSFGIGANTDENGNYEISVYPAAGYRVGVWDNRFYKTVYYKNTSNWEEAALIDTTKESVTGIDFTMNMGASIAGTVSGLEKGDAVTIETWSLTKGYWSSTSVTGTGSDVSFKIRGLEEGDDYVINIWAEGYLSGCIQKEGGFGNCYSRCYMESFAPCSEEEQTSALFKAGATDVKITMDRGKKISGTISGISQGNEIWITAYSESGAGKSGKSIAANGNTADFTLTGLADASDYRIWAEGKGYISGYYGGSDSATLVSWNKAALVSTKEGDATGIKIAMSSGNSISGVIKGLDKDTKALVSAWSESTGFGGEISVAGTGYDVTYEIKCLSPAEDFRVSVWSDGYIGGYYSAEGMTGWEDADLIDSSVNPANISFTLSKGKTISGTVTGLKKGDWATVEAYCKNRDNQYIDILPVKQGVWSDVAGMRWGGNQWGMASLEGTGEPVSYKITGLASANDFIVVLRAYGYAMQMKSDVDSSTDPANINFTATEGKSISGTIAGITPNGLVWVSVWSESVSDSGYAQTQADENGKAVYEIKGLGNASDYVVNVWSEKEHLFYNQQLSWDKATRVDLSQASAKEINFDFSAIEKYIISGTIAGVTEDANVWLDVWSETQSTWGNAQVQGNGAFSVKVPAGDYRIGIYADGYVNVYYDGESGTLTHDWSAAKPLSLTENKALGTLTLSTGYSISGTVTDSEGAIVTGARVEVFGDNGWGGADTDKEGKYRIGGLVSGTYAVSIWSFGGKYNGTVTIKDSDLEYDITLENSTPNRFNILGNLPVPAVADDEAALKNGNIMIVVLFDSNGKFVNSVETDASGNYSFGNLAPGEYSVKREKEDGTLEDLDTLTVKEE